ncbi:MAG: FAD-linked oxidase C-terminal domain-containing protein [Pseudomonadota bacterium]
MKRASLAQDLKSLTSVIKGQKGLLSGVKEATKIAVAGRDFVSDDDYSVHVVCEGRSASAVDADLAEARQIAKRYEGREVENTIPKVVRANPFTPLNNMIGPKGERWAPVHGIVSHAKAPVVWREIDAYFQSMSDRFEKHGVTTGYLVTTISTNGFLLEPVFYWPEALNLIHEETVEASTLARITPFEKNDAATAIVHEARARVAEIFLSHGAAHFQIGKTYLYRDGRKPSAWELLDAIKSVLDPQRRINPGSLGLD